MGLSRNKVAVSEGAAGSPPFYGEMVGAQKATIYGGSLEIEYICCSIFSDRGKHVVGAVNAQGPPVPIPNTEVKLCSAEDTSLETARENRSAPTPREGNLKRGCSSVGRAPALQAGGHGFESHHLHQTGDGQSGER